MYDCCIFLFFFFQAEDGIRDKLVTGVQTCALPISSSNIVVLDVNRHNVPFDRRFLEIRYHPPERWTIVRCEPRVIERLGRIFPLTYAVCPACRHRQGIEARTNEMTCDRCHKAAAMAWDELS